MATCRNILGQPVPPQTLLSIVEQVRKESECRQAGFYQDVENENDFLVVEEWENPRRFG
jgi:quinol monooxygenase YgiN